MALFFIHINLEYIISLYYVFFLYSNLVLISLYLLLIILPHLSQLTIPAHYKSISDSFVENHKT